MPVILATWKAEIRRMVVPGQPRKKKKKKKGSQPLAACVGILLSSPALQGSTNRRITVQSYMGRK
jgi:hypothetical protein